MSLRIADYRSREGELKLPPEDASQPEPSEEAAAAVRETHLRDILHFVRVSTGRDFGYCKRGTIVRRISRRMQVSGVVDMLDYLTVLRTQPGEATALVAELLISVTNFFRDRESFQVLESHIPKLFEGKRSEDVVRVWVAACATGEEAYSMAMLLLEHARTLDRQPRSSTASTACVAPTAAIAGAACEGGLRLAICSACHRHFSPCEYSCRCNVFPEEAANARSSQAAASAATAFR